MARRATNRQNCAHELEFELARYVATSGFGGDEWHYDGALAKADRLCNYVRAAEQIAEKFAMVIPNAELASIREWALLSGAAHTERMTNNTPNRLHMSRELVESDIIGASALIMCAANSAHPSRDLDTLRWSRDTDPSHIWARFFLRTIGDNAVTCVSYLTTMR